MMPFSQQFEDENRKKENEKQCVGVNCRGAKAARNPEKHKNGLI